ncbi:MULTISPECIES: hypothetical protein [unclassified Streptomyces]|uniref:hypothetical protein n=1 Tax=unclassified Streptomyces TaxID=2593676 RepID=UPI00081EEBE0|nr:MULTISPECIES: hypothetical protein [unclassified Streptomyces]MYR26062.1 hypothetical protein [Streptomyces sp. SID4945]SCE94648.1 hypothetical protein GA0115257_104817 [Streptomyces sp. LcepLS]
MRHRSTALSATLGGISLVAALGGTVAVLVEAVTRVGSDDDGPMWTALVLFGLAVVGCALWLLAVRAAPGVERLPDGPVRAGIPRHLAPIRRNWPRIGQVLLFLLAPYVLVRVAAPSAGSVLGELPGFLLLIGTIAALARLPLLLSGQLPPPLRGFRRRVASGQPVLATRARLGRPLRVDVRTASATGSGEIVTSVAYGLAVTPEGAREVVSPQEEGFFGVEAVDERKMYRLTIGERHLSHSVAQLAGHQGWFCVPREWRAYTGVRGERPLVPAFFASDTGHVVWAAIEPVLVETALAEGFLTPRETDIGLRAAPVRRPSFYLARAHDRVLALGLGVVLATVPAMTGLVPAWATVLFGVAGLALLGRAAYVAVTAPYRFQVQDERLWKHFEFTDPALR